MAAVYLEFYVFLCFIFTLQVHISAQFVNVAKGKPAYQSSYYDNSFKASTAVDGVTKENGHNCMHTAIGKSYTWWEVDLGKLYFVHEVKIYFRTDYKTRRRGVQIYTNTAVNSSNTGHLCGTVTGRRDGSDIPDVLKFTCNVNARYVTVYQGINNGKDIGTALDFLELEVYVCELNVKYGPNCDKVCEKRHCVNTHSSCDVQTGKCDIAGCTAGWNGTDCREECNPGTYGKNCKSRCENCRSKRCDRFSGNCTGGCIEGYEGIFCKQELEDMTRNVNLLVETAERNIVLHSLEITECPIGMYGEGCLQICADRHCHGNQKCDFMTGLCVDGCVAGWQGISCNTVLQQIITDSFIILFSCLTVLALILGAAALILVIRSKRTATKSKQPAVSFFKSQNIQSTTAATSAPVYEAVDDDVDAAPASDQKSPRRKRKCAGQLDGEITQHNTDDNQQDTNHYDALQVETVDQGSAYEQMSKI